VLFIFKYGSHCCVADHLQSLYVVIPQCVNVGPSLANRISDSSVKYNTYLRGDYKDSFSLYPACPQEVINIVKS